MPRPNQPPTPTHPSSHGRSKGKGSEGGRKPFGVAAAPLTSAALITSRTRRQAVVRDHGQSLDVSHRVHCAVAAVRGFRADPKVFRKFYRRSVSINLSRLYLT
jgi:hypothetical protein